MAPRTALDAPRAELAKELAGVIAQRDHLAAQLQQMESLLAAAADALALSNANCRQLQATVELLSERIEDVARSPFAAPVRGRLRALRTAPLFAGTDV